MSGGRAMVSTLHITLSNNQPSPQWLGRSASCEETNLLGFSSALTSNSKTTSLSASSVLRAQAPGAGVPGVPSSKHNLVAPTPYSPSAASKVSSWSPVRFKTKPLPDFLKKLNQESVVDSPGANQTKGSRCRAAAPQGTVRLGLATSTGDGQAAETLPTLAARWSPAAKHDSSKPELSPRAGRKVLGIPITSATVSPVSQVVAPIATGGPSTTPQGTWRSISGGSPSRTRKEVSPAPTNDSPVRPVAESSPALQDKPLGVAVQKTTLGVQDLSSTSGQLDETQGSGRRSSLGSASKESPTAPRKQLMSDTAWLATSSRSATMPALRTSSAPWQQRPNRLSSASLQFFEDVSISCLHSSEQLCFCFRGHSEPSVLEQ